jgi:hypothetical protein
MSPQTSLGWVGIRSRCLDTLDNCCFEFFNGTTSQMVSKKIKNLSIHLAKARHSRTNLSTHRTSARHWRTTSHYTLLARGTRGLPRVTTRFSHALEDLHAFLKKKRGRIKSKLFILPLFQI